MFNYITYGTYKTTTIRPANCSFTSERQSSSGRRYVAETLSNVGLTKNYTINQAGTTGTTDCHGMYSRTISTLNQKFTEGNFASEQTFDVYGGHTSVRSTSENRWTESFSMKDGTRESSGSTTGSYPEATVSKPTTTTESYKGQIRTTSAGSIYTWVLTTSVPEGSTKEIVTTIISSTFSPREVRTDTTFTRTITTTNETETFITYTEWSRHVVVVQDTVILTVSAASSHGQTALGRAGALAVIQTKTGTQNLGLHAFSYLTQNTTISWVPPLTISEIPTIEPFTTQTATSVISLRELGDQTDGFTDIPITQGFRNARYTTGTKSITIRIDSYSEDPWFAATQVTFTCENWVTYTTESTTTNSSTSGTVSISSFSLDTGYTEMDDEGNVTTYVPYGYSYQTGPFTNNNWTTTTSETVVTDTTWEDSYSATTLLPIEIPGSAGGVEIQIPQVKSLSKILGVEIVTYFLPWKTKKGYAWSIANSLNTSTNITSTKSVTGRCTTFFETEFSRAVSQFQTYNFTFQASGRRAVDSKESNGFTKLQTSSGTIFATAGNNLSVQSYQYTNRQQAWATSAEFGPFAAADEYDYTTTPTRTEAALIFTMQGNQHTIPVEYNYEGGPRPVPNEVEPILYPTFSAVLNKNDCGYGAHPSVWSTITLSRAGKSISSTWQYQTNGSNGTVNTTASGTCAITTESQFPYGVRQLGAETIGGNMQPNQKIVLLKAPGVYLTITADSAASTSGFTTQESWSTEQITASALTISRGIPIINGVGYYSFSILDFGLP